MPDSTKHVRLLLARFHPLILERTAGFRREMNYDIQTISAEEGVLLPAVDRVRPDVVLLDLLQTGSLGTIRGVRGICPPCRVVALTGMRHTDSANSVFSAGASGILYRFSAAAELFIAVRTVLSGHLYLSPAFTTLSGDTAGKRTRFSSALSASDKLVLRLVARGYPAHRIAQALGLSVGIVRLSITHRTRQFGRHTK